MATWEPPLLIKALSFPWTAPWARSRGKKNQKNRARTAAPGMSLQDRTLDIKSTATGRKTQPTLPKEIRQVRAEANRGRDPNTEVDQLNGYAQNISAMHASRDL